MCDKANSALLLKMSASGSCFSFVTLKVKANISVDTLCQKFWHIRTEGGGGGDGGKASAVETTKYHVEGNACQSNAYPGAIKINFPIETCKQQLQRLLERQRQRQQRQQQQQQRRWHNIPANATSPGEGSEKLGDTCQGAQRAEGRDWCTDEGTQP